MATGIRAWSVFGEIGLGGLGEVTRSLIMFDTVGRRIGGSLLGLQGSSLLAAGGFAALGLGIASLVTSGVQQFAQFDDAMAKSTAIMGDINGQMRADLEDTARDVARHLQITATEAAQSYYFLASAGLSAAQSLQALPIVARFATAGQMQMAKATEYLANVQAALGMRSQDLGQNLVNLTRISDVLSEANNRANASTEQFAEALSNKAGARMRVLNMSIEEGTAVLSAYADQGVKGALAGERLNYVLRDLPRFALSNAAAFHANNIEVFEASGNLRNFADIIADFERRIEGMSDAQRTQMFIQLGMNERVADGILGLVGTSDAIRKYQADLEQAGGTTQDVADRQLNSINAQWDLLKHKVTDSDMAIGSFVRGPVINMLRAFNGIAETLNSVIEKMGLFNRTVDNLHDPPSRLSRFLFGTPGTTDTGVAGATPYLGVISSVTHLGQQFQMQQEGDRRLHDPNANAGAISDEWRLPLQAANEGRIAMTARQTAAQEAANEAQRTHLEQVALEAGASGNLAEKLRALQGILALITSTDSKWDDIQNDIIRTRGQMARQSATQARTAAREQQALQRETVQYELASGKMTTAARIAEIDTQLQHVQHASKAELDLLTERQRLVEQQTRQEQEWADFQVQTGQLTLQQRLAQIRALMAAETGHTERRLALERAAFSVEQQLHQQAQALVAFQIQAGLLTREKRLEQLNAERVAGFATVALDLENNQERMRLGEELAQEQITAAQQVARINRDAATQTLTAWKAAHAALIEAFPALGAQVDRAIAEIQTGLEKHTNKVSADMKRQGVQIGVQLITGILQGSRDMGSILRNALISIFSEVLTHAAYVALGIASPSRKTYYMGQMLMEGFAGGIDDSAGIAMSSMTRNSSNILGALGGALTNAHAVISAPLLDSAHELGAEYARRLGEGLQGGAHLINAALAQSLPDGGGFSPRMLAAGGLGAGIQFNVPVDQLPRPLTPFEAARDRQWVELFSHTERVYKARGGRP